MTATTSDSIVTKRNFVVAIDGPAGTGKSSATKMISDALGFVHVDTGALYRAIALVCLEKGIIGGEQTELDDSAAAAVTGVAQSAKLEFQRSPKLKPANRILVNGQDVTARIRTPEVSMGASLVSGVPGVRNALVDLQRRLGSSGQAVLEGRDIGTVIFPDADVKFFLTASLEARADRRLAELMASGGVAPSYDELKEQIAKRDHADSTRKQAPLKKADEAIQFDTTHMTLNEVVQLMVSIIRALLRITEKYTGTGN
ncbi:MAG: (d)CMP kinase [Bacteriovoracia bacterium]